MRFAYQKPDGEVVWRERAFADGPPPATIEVDGVVARRSYQAERVGVPPTKGWPLTCYASGVGPEQAQELRDEFKRLGVPTEVTPGGDPIYTSAAHRKKALRARGLFDRAAYY